MIENLKSLFGEYSSYVVKYGPTVAGVLGITVGGWLLALVVRRLIFAALSRAPLQSAVGSLFGSGQGAADRAKRAVAQVGYFSVLGLVLLALLDFVGLDAVTHPLLAIFEGLAGAVPGLLKAAVLGVIGYVVARLARGFTVRVLDKTQLVARLEGVTEPRSDVASGSNRTSAITQTIGNVVFGVVLVVVSIPVLEALQVGMLAAPLSAAFHAVSVHVPRIAAAVLLAVVGYVLGLAVRAVLRATIDGVGVDRSLKKMGMGALFGSSTAGHVVGSLAMAFVMLHFLISAVGRLGIEEISEPLGLILVKLYGYLPKLVVAALLTVLALVLSRVVSRAAGSLLAAVGFNRLMVHVGFAPAAAAEGPNADAQRGLRKKLEGRDKTAMAAELIGEAPAAGSPSGMAGLFLGAVLFLSFAQQILSTLELSSLAGLLSGFLAFLPRLLVALCVIAFGTWAGSWAKKRINTLTRGSSDGAVRMLGGVARIAIVVVAAMVGLQQLGIGRELITSAFTLMLGALALAAALAFGLGGRELARDLLEERRAARRGHMQASAE